jgi:DNA-binding transcriptional regulator YiaG
MGRVRNARSGHVLALELNSKGYASVKLYGGTVNGRKVKRRRLVHRMVLGAFVGQAPAGLQACHNDGDKSNNRLTNLRYDTAASNMADKLRHGTHARGQRAHNAKLTLEDVRSIRSRAGSASQREMAREYGVSQAHISAIVRRKEWAWA